MIFNLHHALALIPMLTCSIGQWGDYAINHSLLYDSSHYAGYIDTESR